MGILGDVVKERNESQIVMKCLLSYYTIVWCSVVYKCMERENTLLSSFETTNQSFYQFYRNVIKLILRKREFGSFVIFFLQGVEQKRFPIHIIYVCCAYSVVELNWIWILVTFWRIRIFLARLSVNFAEWSLL